MDWWWWWAWCAGICWIPGGDAPHRLDVRRRGAPCPPSVVLRPALPPLSACPCPRGPTSPLPSLPPGPLPAPSPWFLHAPSPLPSGPCVVSLPLSIRTLAFSAGALVLPVPLPVSFVAFARVPPSAAHALARPVCLSLPAAAGPGALSVPLPSLIAVCALARPLGPPPGAAACTCVLRVRLRVFCAVPCVPPSAARALVRPLCLSIPAAAVPGFLPVSLPSLIAASALARPLRLSPGASSVAFRPSPRVPVARAPPRRFAVSALLDQTPGVSLPLQLQQRDARRRTLGRWGADEPRPPLREGSLGRVQL